MNTTQATVETTVTLPSLGENVTEATVTRWLKTPGEFVTLDEPLLEVATDKVDTEVPAPVSGLLVEILAQEEELVTVGAPLAVLKGQAPIDTPAPQVAEAVRAPISAPLSLPNVLDDAASAPAADGARGDRVQKLTRIRRTIARHMIESLQVAAQLTTVVEADVTSIARLRTTEKNGFHSRTGQKLSYFPFFVSAAVAELAKHPVINSSLNADCTEVTYHGPVHLGIAVDNEKGLMVPVIRNAHTMSIATITQAIAEAADHVRSATVRPDDLAGATFTITNTGSRGALFDTPIINQPQSAILGVGSVVERVVPVLCDAEGMHIGIRSLVYLSLSYDHRIVDGADAARYLSAVRQRLETGFDATALN